MEFKIETLITIKAKINFIKCSTKKMSRKQKPCLQVILKIQPKNRLQGNIQPMGKILSNQIENYRQNSLILEATEKIRNNIPIRVW